MFWPDVKWWQVWVDVTVAESWGHLAAGVSGTDSCREGPCSSPDLGQGDLAQPLSLLKSAHTEPPPDSWAATGLCFSFPR